MFNKKLTLFVFIYFLICQFNFVVTIDNNFSKLNEIRIVKLEIKNDLLIRMTYTNNETGLTKEVDVLPKDAINSFFGIEFGTLFDIDENTNIETAVKRILADIKNPHFNCSHLEQIVAVQLNRDLCKTEKEKAFFKLLYTHLS